MAGDNKYFETGSNPYYLNLNNTAKDFSLSELTNPSFGLLDTLTKFMIVENNTEIIEPVIQPMLIIQNVEEINS